MDFDTDSITTKIYEILDSGFTEKSIKHYAEIFKCDITVNDKETIIEFVQDKVSELMTKFDAEIVDALMDLEFDIDDMKEMEEFERELEMEDELDQKTNTFGIPVEKEVESKIEEESELDWNEAE